MEQLFLVDAGVLLTNWTQKNPEYQFLTTSTIINEIKNRPSIQRIESLISLDRLVIEDVDEIWIQEVRSAATETGDIAVLSSPDIDLLALAVQKYRSNVEVTVVSTDMAVLNTAHFIGLEILNPRGNMKHDIRWILKCPACGNSSANIDVVECIVCGTEMKRRPASRRRIK